MTQHTDPAPTSELTPDQLVWTVDFDEHSHRSGIVEHRVAMISGERIGLVNRQRHEGWWYDRKLIFTDFADAQTELERRRRLRITTPPENTTQPAFRFPLPQPASAATVENITKASQTAGLLVDDLRQALKIADAVTALMLLDLIEATAATHNRLQALTDAVSTK